MPRCVPARGVTNAQPANYKCYEPGCDNCVRPSDFQRGEYSGCVRKSEPVITPLNSGRKPLRNDFYRRNIKKNGGYLSDFAIFRIFDNIDDSSLPDFPVSKPLPLPLAGKFSLPNPGFVTFLKNRFLEVMVTWTIWNFS